MRNSISFTTLLLLTCLSSEAQYSLLRRGQVVPFDSAIAIEITQYRAIRIKAITADMYIESLKQEIVGLRQEVNAMDSMTHILSVVTRNQEEFRSANAKSFSDLNEKFNTLLIETTTPKRWYERRGVLIGIGVLGTYLITR